MNWYGVKLIYKYQISGCEISFYEESILAVRADSFEEAYGKAERVASKWCETYENAEGQIVTQSICRWVDCFLVGEELAEGTELYSCFFQEPNQNRPCTAEELRPLRRK